MTDDPRINPADLRNIRFPGSSRRYDARSVDQFLDTVASRIAATNVLVDELRAQLDEAAAAPPPAPAAGPSDLSLLDDDEIVRLVGEETATVLSTARRAAEEIRSKAEASASRVIREATAEADRLGEEARARAAELTAEAEVSLQRATAEAEDAAGRIRTAAEQEAERLRTEAEGAAAEMRAAAEARRADAEAEAELILADAREEGRAMVAEAKEVRGRILEDLQRRRDVARDQIERLLAGRERLLAAYELVRENLDDITGQLADALPDAPEPELPDGFSGVVGGTSAAPAGDAEPEDGAETHAAAVSEEPDDTVAPANPGAEPDDVAASSDDDAEADAGDDPPGDPSVAVAYEDDEPVEVTETDPAPAQPDEPVEVRADADEPGAGDVDALFARLRAEREESVARAQQLLDESAPEAAPAEAAPAEAAPAEAASAPEAVPAGETAEAEPGGPAGDVDEIPSEFLAADDDIARRSEALDEIDGALNRALKRRLADEQNEMLDLLRREATTDPATLLPEVDGQVQGYASIALPHLTAAAAAGGSDRADITSLAEELGRTIVEPFHRRVTRAAADVDGDPDELDERLRALYREWKVQHLGPAARDALLSAYGRGSLEAAGDHGKVRWRIDPSQGPCPDAQDNALAGAVDAGEAFPTGDACPQAHPGCRCLLVVE